jgi:hypothetical protein
MRVFELDSDLQIRDRWYLRAPRIKGGLDVNPEIFTQAEHARIDGELELPLRRPGKPLDFTLADFSMPVIRRELGIRLLEVAGESVELIPVEVEGQTKSFCVLNVLAAARCLDETRSEVTIWTEKDGRPEKVGQYRMVLNLHVRPNCHPHPIFRLSGWEASIIVTEPVAEILKPGLGVVLRDVT